MSIKQKIIAMKNLLLPSILMLFLASCITTTHVHYSDPNYLESNEFSTYEEMTVNNQVENETITTDTGTTVNNYYEADDYYDYSFSSRIRRFHRPMSVLDIMVEFILTTIGLIMTHFIVEQASIMVTTGILLTILTTVTPLIITITTTLLTTLGATILITDTDTTITTITILL